jgi:homoserine O-acetyltransferase
LPAVDTRDQARALAAVLDHVGVSRVRAVVGASYGGMVALAFAALFPRRVAHVVAIGAAHRAHPMATALRAVQRDVVRLGLRTGHAAQALSLARALGVATYRSADEFAARFDNRPRLDSGSARFPVQDYLDHCGERFAAGFPPECFLRLSESIDLHDVAPESIRVPATLVSVDRDGVAPPWQVRELAARLGAPTRIVDVHSIYGHDAFLKEAGVFSGLLRDVLSSPPTRGGAR